MMQEAISSILARPLGPISDQSLFVRAPTWQSTLRGSMLPQNAAHTALGNLHLAAQMIDASPPTRGAQKFPDAASSVFITTNLSFSEWAQVLGDAKLTTALLERLTHCCHILETGNDSYRFKAGSEAAKKTTKEHSALSKT